MDEVDSLLSQRSSSDFEATRRIKTEFLVALDGAGTIAKERVLVIGNPSFLFERVYFH